MNSDFQTDVFISRFAELKKESGETNKDLQDVFGLSLSALINYQTGKRIPDIAFLHKLAQHFGVSADYLLGLSDVRSTEQDIQTACEVTGLSEKAVKMLKDSAGYKDAFYKNNILPILNAMLETKDFYRIADRINAVIVSQKRITINKKITKKKVKEEFGIDGDFVLLGTPHTTKQLVNAAECLKGTGWEIAPMEKMNQAVKFQVEFEFRELYTKIADTFSKEQEQKEEKIEEDYYKLSDFFEAIPYEKPDSEQEVNPDAQHHTTQE